jgi:hypothetical protein
MRMKQFIMQDPKSILSRNPRFLGLKEAGPRSSRTGKRGKSVFLFECLACGSTSSSQIVIVMRYESGC